MTCEIKDTPDGRFFICWEEGGPPKEKRVKCSVCKRRWSTLLCDGAVPGPVTSVEDAGQEYRQMAPMTCDVPLCERCTVRAAPGVVALPDHREHHLFNGVQTMKTMVALAKRKQSRGPASRLRDDLPLLLPKPVHVETPADTVDFCPTCAARLPGQVR